MGDENVHILDPFTGTGTFITRLLQSGLISKEQLAHKYQNEIHANEIVLLAYYIAAINIEAVYHDLMGGDYQPFDGICLTDTFQLHEKDDLVSKILVDNSARRIKQKELDLRVIIGNPPYSAGQKSGNDNNANVAYPSLDERIAKTYVYYSRAGLSKGLYDSYVRAVRWASDRIGKSGVIGFVTNASFIEANTADGLRKCLADEFSSIYIFHLRGNQRTSGELSRKEGGKIFGSGSRAPIAISLLVKNPDATSVGNIYLHDIGDYLSQADKLEKISGLGSISGISNAQAWQSITPDEHYDWVNQRDDSFDEFILMGDKKGQANKVLFNDYTLGVATNRDAWVFSYSKAKLLKRIKKMILFYNEEVRRYKRDASKKVNIDDFINNDPTLISWTRGLKKKLTMLESYTLSPLSTVKSSYRPFTKQNLFFDKFFNEMVLKVPKVFPSKSVENKVICITGKGSTKEFCAFMTDTLPDLELISKGQCFPLKLYEPTQVEEKPASSNTGKKPQGDLFAQSATGITSDLFEQPATPKSKELKTTYTVSDGLTDEGLAHFQAAYPDEDLSKEDIFYYIYGLLHSEEYRERYADNLTKTLPRIPCVKQAADFWYFSQAGRDLAELHINYENKKRYPVTLDCGKRSFDELSDDDFYVTQMKFADKKDHSAVEYNHAITMRDIPLDAYEYIVNGKSALAWVMERQGVRTHKDSGIVNDANDWARETMKNARYPLELFQRVITVSLETMKIVKGLPKLDIETAK